MIELFYWPTPNAHKITIFLEDTGLPYRIVRLNIRAGDQFKPEFLAISPNNRMPAIVDHEPADGGAPLSLFESGAILEYLGEKTGKFLPPGQREKFGVLQWLYWQMARLGPMAAQNHHFAFYAPEKLPYALDRYVKETNRLCGVLDRQLGKTGNFIAGDYSIADMASYPWVVPWKQRAQNLDDFPHVKRWLETIGERAAVRRAYELEAKYRPEPTMTDAERKVLFGKTAAMPNR